MQCISPIYIRKISQNVPCGSCNFCLQKKRNDWSFRLAQEFKVAENASFLTMTYEDELLPLTRDRRPQLSKRHMQLFNKRVRKLSPKLRYYAVGEYGTETDRPHYHSIMFNHCDNIEKYWEYGHIHVGEVTPASIHYVTKYIINSKGASQAREPPFSLMSRRPGIGQNYMDTHEQWHKAQTKDYTKVKGQYGAIPRYYRDRLFNRVQKDLNNQKRLEQSDIEYQAEINRLQKFHADPSNYHYEKIVQSYNRIKDKLNEKNTF